MGKVRFDPSISVGTVLTIISIFSSLIFIWHKMDVQLVLLDARSSEMQRQIELLNKTVNSHGLSIEHLSTAISTRK